MLDWKRWKKIQGIENALNENAGRDQSTQKGKNAITVK